MQHQHHGFHPSTVLVLFVLLCRSTFSWNPADTDHPCTIPRVTVNHFGPHGLPSLYPSPVILLLSQQEEAFSKDASRKSYKEIIRRTERDGILAWFGNDFAVTLSSSNAISEHRRTVPLSTYLEEIHSTSTESTNSTALVPANETWYLFGETHSSEWIEFLQPYPLPPCRSCDDHRVTLSFGIGNQGSGVQWHTHGPGFSETLHGRKHWMLLPPSSTPPPGYHKDQSSRQWMEDVYPMYDSSNGTFASDQSKRIWECTLYPGEAIYFPDRWWHATINLEPYTAFISTFTTEHDEL